MIGIMNRIKRSVEKGKWALLASVSFLTFSLFSSHSAWASTAAQLAQEFTQHSIACEKAHQAKNARAELSSCGAEYDASIKLREHALVMWQDFQQGEHALKTGQHLTSAEINHLHFVADELHFLGDKFPKWVPELIEHEKKHQTGQQTQQGGGCTTGNCGTGQPSILNQQAFDAQTTALLMAINDPKVSAQDKVLALNKFVDSIVSHIQTSASAQTSPKSSALTAASVGGPLSNGAFLQGAQSAHPNTQLAHGLVTTGISAQVMPGGVQFSPVLQQQPPSQVSQPSSLHSAISAAVISVLGSNGLHVQPSTHGVVSPSAVQPNGTHMIQPSQPPAHTVVSPLSPTHTVVTPHPQAFVQGPEPAKWFVSKTNPKKGVLAYQWINWRLAPYKAQTADSATQQKFRAGLGQIIQNTKYNQNNDKRVNKQGAEIVEAVETALPGTKALFDGNNHGDTIREHTVKVLDTTLNQMHRFGIQNIAVSSTIKPNITNPVNVQEVLRAAVALHDIGKPLGPDSTYQKSFNKPLVEHYLQQLGFNKDEVTLGLTLVEDGHIGAYGRNSSYTLTKAKSDIEEKARSVGMDPASYFKLAYSFYSSDAGYYSDLEFRLFEKDQKTGKLKPEVTHTVGARIKQLADEFDKHMFD